MATPEERKSKLQAARRAQANKPHAPSLDWTGDIPQKTEEPLNDLGQQKNYARQRQEALYGLHGRERELELGRIRKQESGELRGRALYSKEARRQEKEEDKINKEAEKRAQRKYRPGWEPEALAKEETERNKLLLNKSRLQQSRVQNPINIPSASKDPTSEQSAGDDSDQQTERLAGIQAARRAQTNIQRAPRLDAPVIQRQIKEEQELEKTRELQKRKKRMAKAALRNGFMYVINILVAPVLLLNVIVWIFSLGWKNAEMIYGKHIAKGKSKFVDPISSDPIPMAIDKDALILQGFVVAADIAVGIAILVLSFGGFCIVHDFVKVTSSITEAAQIGTALAREESGGLCLGGIITSAFGL